MSRYESGGHVHGGAAVAAGGGGMSIKEGVGGRDAHEDDLVMPGFRFHPTEEELIEFYLRRKVEGKRFNVELITFLDLYRYDPWELPGEDSANNWLNFLVLALSIALPPQFLISLGLNLLSLLCVQQWRRLGRKSGSSTCQGTASTGTETGRTG
jgi:hypothetical protein